jgi:uncharacterized protein YgbK (DUF1537 family)
MKLACIADDFTAVAESLEALRWLLTLAPADTPPQVYFKYCSTFDSTAQGNIGPVSEALMAALACPLTIATPAFPDNGRSVFKGLQRGTRRTGRCAR